MPIPGRTRGTGRPRRLPLVLILGGLLLWGRGTIAGPPLLTTIGILVLTSGALWSALAILARRRLAERQSREGEQALNLALISVLGRQDDEKLEQIARSGDPSAGMAGTILAERRRRADPRASRQAEGG